MLLQNIPDIRLHYIIVFEMIYWSTLFQLSYLIFPPAMVKGNDPRTPGISMTPPSPPEKNHRAPRKVPGKQKQPFMHCRCIVGRDSNCAIGVCCFFFFCPCWSEPTRCSFWLWVFLFYFYKVSSPSEEIPAECMTTFLKNREFCHIIGQCFEFWQSMSQKHFQS